MTDQKSIYPPKGAQLHLLDGHAGAVLGQNHFASGRASQVRYDRDGEAWIIEIADIEPHPDIPGAWRQKPAAAQ